MALTGPCIEYDNKLVISPYAR